MTLKINEVAKCIADNCAGTLQRLALVGEYGPIDSLNDETLIYLALRCRQLQYLDVSKSDYLSDDAFTVVAESCSELTVWITHGCRFLTDVTVNAIAQHCTKLQELDLSWCDRVTNVSLSILGSANASLRASLRSLKFESCYNITSKVQVENLTTQFIALSVNSKHTRLS